MPHASIVVCMRARFIALVVRRNRRRCPINNCTETKLPFFDFNFAKSRSRAIRSSQLIYYYARNIDTRNESVRKIIMKIIRCNADSPGETA